MIIKAYITEVTNKRDYTKQDGTKGYAIEYLIRIPQQGTQQVYYEEVVAERYYDQPVECLVGPTNDPQLYDLTLAFSTGRSKDGQRVFQRCRIQKMALPC